MTETGSNLRAVGSPEKKEMAMSKPLIRVTCDYDVQKHLQILMVIIGAILRSGGLPYLIPGLTKGQFRDYRSIGWNRVYRGGDVDPAYFGEAPNQGLGP